MKQNVYIAVDLGAGSGRVFLCDLGARFELVEIHRFTYPPREVHGHLRWDFSKIFGEIKTGLRKASSNAGKRKKTIVSIGVDSWAVDYGLPGQDGELLEDPICYRDARTNGMMEQVFAIVPRAEIFKRTGIQFLNFNTIFQYTAEKLFDNATAALLLPDLINFYLSGRKVAEYTNATTTQLVDAATKDWDRELIAKLGLPERVFPPIVAAGTDLGPLDEELADRYGLRNVRVIAPATHDTGSAVAGAPLKSHQAYISSGTWSLVGVELGAPLINDEVAKFNFTNEGGVYDTIRFLKNVMGLWILESCRREWDAQGLATDYASLLDGVAALEGSCGVVFPDDERFLNPESMIAAINEQLAESGQNTTSDPIEITKIVLDSLAFRYASVLATIERLTGDKLSGVQIVGGGGKNRYLNQMTADASGLTVEAGLVEATVTGNAVVQAIADGRFADLAEAREFVGQNIALEQFTPRVGGIDTQTAARYAEIEARFLGKAAAK